MKQILIVMGAVIGIGLSIFAFPKDNASQPIGGTYFVSPPTQATSSVGIYTPGLVLSADSGRQYASFCNPSPTTTNFIALQIGATTTNFNGILVPGNSCHEMSVEKGNIFTSDIFARASTSTTTLMMVTK